MSWRAIERRCPFGSWCVGISRAGAGLRGTRAPERGTVGGGAGSGEAAAVRPTLPATAAEHAHSKEPADFTDPESMLGASPALLQGKILRGGMGTGMPYWGPIFTEDQLWALVSYLWSFQFEGWL